MRHFNKIALLFVLLLAIAVPAVLAQEEAPAIPPNTISGMVIDEGSFSTLEAAMEAAGLLETYAGGEWTLFAPTNKAFSKLGLDAKNITKQYTSEQLRDLILYHTLAGRLSTANLKTMQGNVVMQNGGQAGIKFYRNRIYVNDDSRVTGENVAVDNGYIQTVDTVILPPWPRAAEGQVQDTTEGQVQESTEGQVQGFTEGQVQDSTEGQVQGQVQDSTEGQVQGALEGQVQAAEDAPALPAVSPTSIAGIAANDGRFSTLVAAANAAGLYDDLGGGTWTVFAPTDDAFAKLGLNAGNIADTYSAAQLADILLYHVLTGNHSQGALKAMLGDTTMANGALAGLKYYEGSIYVNDDSKVTQSDITADNGVIHAVDTVIQPPWPRVSEPIDLTGQVQGFTEGQVQGQVQ